MTRACPDSHGTRSALHPRRFDLPTDRSSGPRRDLGNRPDRCRRGLGSGSTAATTQHLHGSPSSAVITNLPFGRIKISDIGNPGARTGGVSRHAPLLSNRVCPGYRIVDRGISPRCRVRTEPGCHACPNPAARRQARTTCRDRAPRTSQPPDKPTMFARSCRSARLGSPRCAVCGRQPNVRAASRLNAAAARVVRSGWEPLRGSVLQRGEDE